MPDLMSTSLAQARERILSPTGLDEAGLTQVLDRLMGHAVDSADLYFQLSRRESWSLEDGIVKEGSPHRAGRRRARDQRREDRLRLFRRDRAAGADPGGARPRAPSPGSARTGRCKPGGGAEGRALYQPLDPLETLSDEDKVALLHAVDAGGAAPGPARQAGDGEPCGRRTTWCWSRAATARWPPTCARWCASTSASSSSTTAAASRDPPAAAVGSAMRSSSTGRSRLQHAREAVRQALVNLEAVDAPAGTMTVVLGPGWPGVLLHEAIGHGLEGDFNRKGTSAFAGRIGERVASRTVHRGR